MNGIGPITDTDSIKELERESAEVSRVLFLRRQNSTKATITATTSKAAAPPPMALASVLTGDVFCDVVNDVVDVFGGLVEVFGGLVEVFDNMVDVSGVVQLVLDGSDDALCTVGVPVIVVGVVVISTTVVPVLENCNG
jgi:cephalosporin hydroxylase